MAEISPSPAITTTPSAPVASPSPGPSPTEWWTFTSRGPGYTVRLPPTLQFEGSNPANPQYHFIWEDYFSNEAVGAPTFMDEKGIFFDINVIGDTGDQCVQHDLRAVVVDRERAITVDGNRVSLKLVRFTGPDGEAPSLLVAIPHDDGCYLFRFITWSRDVRDATEPVAVKILESFRFGPRPTPTT